jgi:AcrR family transcriptional regulator
MSPAPYHGRMTSDQGSLQLGRPRDQSIDIRVLDATRLLLKDRGFDETTIRAIAETSGVHASAIYRRWRSRTEIIEEAVFPGLSSVIVRPTGDLRRDLRRFIRAQLTAFGAPEAKAAMPGLLASYQSSGRSGAPEDWLAVSARPQFLDILLRAPASSVDPGVDPNDVFDLLLGAMMARVLVPTVAVRNRPVEQLVESVHRLVQRQPDGAEPSAALARSSQRGGQRTP